MKQIIIFLLFSTLLVNADEIARINTVVSEIKALKAENKKLKEEHALEINSLNNQITILNSKIKTKDNPKICPKIKKQKSMTTQRKTLDNQFPALKMKKKYADVSSLVYFRAASFRINGNVSIYDGINGKVIQTWSDQTSFTSNQRVGNWIKVTGYFVDKVWQPSEEEMWVKSCNVLKRSQVSN